MTLEQQLSAGAEPWLAAEELASDRVAHLEALVKRRSRWRRLLRMSAATGAAAVITGVVMLRSVVVSLASSAPLVGPFITRWAQHDQGAYWAEQKGFVVPVGKSATDQGYTFRVENVVADSARTLIYYTIDGPDLSHSTFLRRLDVTFNYRDAFEDWGWGGNDEVVDGRIVGSIELAPLSHPVTQVGIQIEQIGEVKGDWQVSFMASRETLDRMTRAVPIEKQWKGEGYDLTARGLVQAPTAVAVEIGGTAGMDFEIRQAELVVDGHTVEAQSGASNGQMAQGGVPTVNYRFLFDRLAGEPESVLFRLADVIQWQDGGPAIDLRWPGQRVEYGAVWYELSSVELKGDRTDVVMQIPPEYPWLAHIDFRDWVLTDSAGKEYTAGPQTVKPPGSNPTAEMRVSFPAAVQGAVRLEARQHAEPVPGPFEVTIPMK